MNQNICVWAPFAKTMAAQVGTRSYRMKRQPNDWWTTTVPTLAVRSDYGFLVDGEGPYPDPRSPWQPNGVHGLSRLVDHTEHRWKDSGWRAPALSQAIIYELHVGTFTPAGTFKAAIEKLDHLGQLGVTHIELMPVNEFSGHHGWGYDGVDLFAPHHAYGTPNDLKALVDACHARQLAVLLDVVYNHLGPTGNYLGKFGPYFSSRYATPWGEAVNFDSAYCDEVRRFFCDNALMWLRDYHFDGLRLDAVQAMLDTSAEPFLEQLSLEVKQLEKQLDRPLVLIAESDLNDPRLLWPRERGGFALNAQWNDDFHHALHAILTGETAGYYADFGSIGALAKALERAFVYDGRYSSFRKRRHGRPPADLSGHSFLGYLQNHDQIGNRAQGERSSRLMSRGRIQIAAALVLTAPFVPMLFQGEEWGASTPFLYFTDHAEPELGRAVTEGRRREFTAFGWNAQHVPDPQVRETFVRSKLNWSEIGRSEHARMLKWHRQLIRLRKEQRCLSNGRLDQVRVRFDERAKWLSMERAPLSIICNFAARKQRIPMADKRPRHVLLSSVNDTVLTSRSVMLSAESVAIVG